MNHDAQRNVSQRREDDDSQTSGIIAQHNQESAPSISKEAKARFWSKVDQQGADGCWLWIASRNEDGYGQSYAISRKSVKAHRVSWMIANGPIAGRLQVLHKCDVRACVNPSHLFLGDTFDNMRDMYSKNRHMRPKGESNVKAKLKASDIPNIRASREAGCSAEYLAKIYNVSTSAIYRAAKGSNWSHV